MYSIMATRRRKSRKTRKHKKSRRRGGAAAVTKKKRLTLFTHELANFKVNSDSGVHLKEAFTESIPDSLKGVLGDEICGDTATLLQQALDIKSPSDSFSNKVFWREALKKSIKNALAGNPKECVKLSEMVYGENIQKLIHSKGITSLEYFGQLYELLEETKLTQREDIEDGILHRLMTELSKPNP